MADQYFKSIVPIIKEQFPQFINESESLLVEFVQAYYEWMEKDGNVQDLFYKLDGYQNIDKSLQSFYEEFRHELMHNLPANIQTDPATTFKKIRDLYRAKGTEKALVLLFKILYDENIIVDYPGERILRPSDGSWVTRTFIRTLSGSGLNEFIGRQIYSPNSKTFAIVENITSTSIDGTDVFDINLSSINGIFISGDSISTIDDNPQVVNQITGLVHQYKITERGTGYSINDPVTIVNAFGDTGIGAVAIVKSVREDGGINTLQISNPGYGYVDVPTADLTGIGNGDAVIELLVGGSFITPGFYINNRGFLSNVIVLQDGKKFQDFSYVIKSPINSEQYEQTVRDTVHPAGVFFSGEFSLFSQIDVDDGGSLVIYSDLGIDYDDPGRASTRKFFEPELLLDLDLDVSISALSEHNYKFSSEVHVTNNQVYEASQLEDYQDVTSQEIEDAYGVGYTLEKFYSRNARGDTFFKIYPNLLIS